MRPVPRFGRGLRRRLRVHQPQRGALGRGLGHLLPPAHAPTGRTTRPPSSRGTTTWCAATPSTTATTPARSARPWGSTTAAASVLPHLARQLISLHAQRADVAAQVETLVQAHPLYQVLTSMPGIRGPGRRRPCWPRRWARPPVTGAQLASYSGLAPVTRRSGSSIRGEHVSHGGNKRLKRAMFLSAFASLRSDPVSRAYYQRKRDQGKRHNQAVLALAHRRILTLHAMTRNGTLYDPQPATKLPAAA